MSIPPTTPSIKSTATLGHGYSNSPLLVSVSNKGNKWSSEAHQDRFTLRGISRPTEELLYHVVASTASTEQTRRHTHNPLKAKILINTLSNVTKLAITLNTGSPELLLTQPSTPSQDGNLGYPQVALFDSAMLL